VILTTTEKFYPFCWLSGSWRIMYFCHWWWNYTVILSQKFNFYL